MKTSRHWGKNYRIFLFHSTNKEKIKYTCVYWQLLDQGCQIGGLGSSLPNFKIREEVQWSAIGYRNHSKAIRVQSPNGVLFQIYSTSYCVSSWTKLIKYSWLSSCWYILLWNFTTTILWISLQLLFLYLKDLTVK